jgi:protein TonB
MNQAGYFETRQQFSPTTLAVIVALHAAALSVAILWKANVIPIIPHPTIVTFIPEPKEPDRTPVTHDRTPPKTTHISVPPVQDTQRLTEATLDTVPQLFPPLDPPPLGPVHTDPPPLLEPAHARGDVRTLITSDDYPEAARRNNETGAVRARLEIGTNGGVTGCTIVATSGSTALDSATCRVLKARAHFTPAKDSSGQAVADSYVTPRIVWRIESDG